MPALQVDKVDTAGNDRQVLLVRVFGADPVEPFLQMIDRAEEQ